MTTAERRGALVAPGRTVLGAVSAVVADRPDAVAVADGPGTVTYARLWQTGTALATELAGLAGPAGQGVAGGLVGLCLPRGADLVAGALGIALAGAGYVAMDPAAPADRLRYVVADSGMRALVTTREVAAELGGVDVPVTGIPSGAGADLGADLGDVLTAPDPDDLAYAVYTSGSTGRPKGVAVEHRSLANLVQWHRHEFGLTAEDRVTLLASPGFDASVWEIWPALACGATLAVVPDGLRQDPSALRDWLVDQRVTISFLPTPLAESVLDLEWPAETRLRVLLTGGDRLTRRPGPGLPFRLVNNYGVSEAAVVSTSGIVEPEAGGGTAPSIGRAISGVGLRVVDADLVPVAPGTPGELLICGVSVARGYLGAAAGDPESRFVEDPAEPGSRAYRSGDLVRMSEDGTVEYLGRLDDQVQVRGVRVEPGEVAAVLQDHGAVEKAVVLADPHRPGSLTAYVVARHGVNLDETDLREHLSRYLPAQMLPAEMVEVPGVPVTLNGKVDRDALLQARPRPVEQAGPDQVATGLQHDIGALVADLLGVTSVRADDNFFLLGGHSLLGAQLIARLRAQYDVDLPLLTVFEHPTVAGLADEVERLVTEDVLGMSEDEVLRAAEDLGADDWRGWDDRGRVDESDRAS